MTRRETRRTRRVGWLAALLGAFVLALSVMPVTAWADEIKVGEGEAYVSLPDAVTQAKNDDTIRLTSNITLTKYVFVNGKSITIDGGGHTITRGDGFERHNDGRGGYNPAMIEVANGSTLSLKNITLDDGMKSEAKVFLEQPTSGENKDNENKVQDAMIAAYAAAKGGTGSTIVLGDRATLKNFGGMSAVRVGGQGKDAPVTSKLIMESDSQIIDESETPRAGGVAAVWSQGGVVEVRAGAKISGIDGRALYLEDGGYAQVTGSIENITANAVMANNPGDGSGPGSGAMNDGFAGIAVAAWGNSTFILGDDSGMNLGSISNIKSNDGNPADVVTFLSGSTFSMKKGSVLSEIETIGLMDDNGGHVFIDGAVRECHTNKVLFRVRGGEESGGDFTLEENGVITDSSTTDAGIIYVQHGAPNIIISGTISNCEVSSSGAVFMTQNGIHRGTCTITETGKIQNISGASGYGVTVDGPSKLYVEGEISGCSKYAIRYKGYRNSLVEINGGLIEGNNEGSAQIQVTYASGVSATDAMQHVKVAPGVVRGNTTIDLPPFDVTLDADYAAIKLGNASSAAVTAIEEGVSAVHDDWTVVGSSALWFQPSEVSVHFTASKPNSVKNTGLFAAYVPLADDGTPNGDVKLVEVENGSVIDVTLNGLKAEQSYALMFVNNKEYTLAPDDVTVYTGGGQGDEDYNDGGFPEPTLVNSVDLNDQGDINSLEVGGKLCQATSDASLLDQLMDLLEVRYTDADGSEVTDDEKPGEYTAKFSLVGGYKPSDIKVNGNEINLDGEGTLIVRHTQDVEGAQNGTTTHELLESEPAKSFDHAVAMANGSSPEFYTNDDETREVDAKGIQLLDDDLLVYKGEDRRTPMEEKAAGYLGKPDAGRAYRYEFHYLDLVDAYNGNAWVSASGGTTVWLPYPEGVTAATAYELELKVVHYKDLHREYGITGQDNVNQAIADCEMETMDVTYDSNGIMFDVNRSGFSPFAVVWQTNAHTITATAGNGGTIAPSGRVTVAEGADQTFAITANQGYEVADVKVDGESKGAVTTYTFESVDRDHKIEAAFRSTGGGPVTPPSTKYYEITSSAGEGGSISPSGTHEYAAGSDVSFSISPDEGYTVGSVIVDGVNVGQRTSYTFADLDADHTISVTFMPGSAPADPDDTGVSDWLQAGDHIAFLHGYGDGSGTFGPENDMTRAEVAQMFYNLLLDKSRGDVEVKFEDVPADAYYAEAVLTLASRGIVNGTSPETYEPNRPITRAEFVAIAMRFSNGEFEGENTFVDVPEDAWYRDYVVGATGYGWIVGYQDGSRRFGPEDTITRGQATMVTNRMLGRVADGAWIVAHLGELKTFVDLGQDHYAFFDVVEATNAHDYERADGTRYESWTGLSK